MEVGALHSQSKQSERMKKDEKKAVVVVMTVMTGHKDRCVVNKCAMWSVERIYSHFTKTRSEVPDPDCGLHTYSPWQKSQNSIK